MGWPRVVGTGEIITVGDDQNQVWDQLTFGGPSCTSTDTSYQGQIIPETGEYRVVSPASVDSIDGLLETPPPEPSTEATLSCPASPRRIDTLLAAESPEAPTYNPNPDLGERQPRAGAQAGASQGRPKESTKQKAARSDMALEG